MIEHYLITSSRNVGRHKLRSFITIAGMMLARTCAIFSAERRSKRTAIREAFSAQIRDIFRRRLWQFSVPAHVAIAWLFTWHHVSGRPEGFADRTSPASFTFFAAGLITVVVTSVTIIAHTLRVTRTNPIRALRYE
jgi:putative ABC transport system permease protein